MGGTTRSSRRGRVIRRHARPNDAPADLEPKRRSFDDGLTDDPRFLRAIERARKSLRAGKGIRLEDIDKR
jgi:hypothetical protein